MKKVKIEYTTPYADNKVNGYVIATDCGTYYTISRAQYNRACDNLTIGNVTPQFITAEGKKVYCDDEVQ